VGGNQRSYVIILEAGPLAFRSVNPQDPPLDPFLVHTLTIRFEPKKQVSTVGGNLVFNVISAYAHQISLNESIKRQFCEQLDVLVSSVSISEKLFIGGDLNGHVGSTRVGFDEVHEGFGYRSRN
jgi:hypothetical protein